MIFRWLQRWLHQHIFKVGWLLTKNSRTTTILYYIFFLPGVVLNQFVYWLVAGLLDVRADRAIRMPETQEIGELKLNFVKLSPKAGRFKSTLISTAPFLAGIIAMWFIATNVFNVPGVLATMSSGTMDDMGAGIGQLLSTPDVWLWFYLAFAISNTMMSPNPQALRGWWRIVGVVVAAVAVLFIVGIGGPMFANGLTQPIYSALDLFAGTFAVIIVLDLFMTAVLAVIENTYEWITGDSATFTNGKMVAIRRTELQAQRQQETARTQLKAGRRSSALPTSSGPPSIYKMPLPLPGAPGKEAVTQLPTAIIQPDRPAAPSLAGDKRGPAVITGTAASVTSAPSTAAALKGTPIAGPSTDQPAAASSQTARTTFPALRPAAPSNTDEESDEGGENRIPGKPIIATPSRPGGFQPLRGTPITQPPAEDSDTADEDADDEPVASPRSTPFQPFRGSAKPGGDDKPATPSARPGGFQPLRGTPITKSGSEADDKPATPTSKPASRFAARPNTSFQPLRGTPDSPANKDEEGEPDEDQPKPPPQPSSPFQSLRGGSSAPRSTSDPRSSLLSDDEDDDEVDDDDS